MFFSLLSACPLLFFLLLLLVSFLVMPANASLNLTNVLNLICFPFVFRIDANVEATELNVEAAHGELLKYFQSVTSNRWLIIKIFCVLIIFFIVFVVFMA